MERPERPARGTGRARRARPTPTEEPAPEKNSKEKRRLQVRMAQRAYRARNQAQVTTLQRRITQLEAALEQMGGAVVSFSDALVQSQVLTSYPQLADPLREMVATCLSLAEASDEATEETSPQPRASPTEVQYHSSIDPSLSSHSIRDPFHDLYSSTILSAFTPNNPNHANSMMDVPSFIEHLRIACLYRGFVMLNNPSIPLDLLWRPFRLLLTLVPRDTITSFFHARLVARLNKRAPETFAEIPFFQLGGAGTHYPELYLPMHHSREWGEESDSPSSTVESSPLSAFSPEVREELEGEWFDVHDLAGYLREKGVLFVTASADGEGRRRLARRVVKALDFTAALVNKSICLGHSPGFRRRDVESAITLSLWE
ncbi:hypothetical protein BJY01DRAFT_256482 [Aspergillus pseudoustus]|uniref:BZIP domain-containing protein n=1 Tax=Aspergillus pseudoustus TaxID=1810923 RepID=A0ABR4IBT4_9EURO